jgi:hypothetical protein
MRRRIIAGILVLLLSASVLASACATSTSSSVSTPQNTTSIATSLAPVSSSQNYSPAISKEQAIAIASPYLPVKIILQSKITVQLEFNQFSTYVWQVSFEGFSATQEELTTAGWESSHYTVFPDYPGSLYHFAYFNIDADTGKLLIKEVNVVSGGPGPETTAAFWLPSERPLETVSLLIHIPNPPNPGGPTIEVNLKNVSDKIIVSLNVELGISYGRFPFEVVFNVSASSPVIPGGTISTGRFLNGAGFETGQYYPIFINGSFQNGTTFGYTQYIQIPKYAPTLP